MVSSTVTDCNWLIKSSHENRLVSFPCSIDLPNMSHGSPSTGTEVIRDGFVSLITVRVCVCMCVHVCSGCVNMVCVYEHVCVDMCAWGCGVYLCTYVNVCGYAGPAQAVRLVRFWPDQYFTD